MHIRDYEIPKATLALLALLLVVAVGAGLYLLRSDSEIPEATETAPSVTTPGTTTMSGTPPPTTPADTTPTKPAPTETTPAAPTPPAFQPQSLPGPPHQRMVADARRVFASFTRAEAPPKGAYWLGPSLNGLDAYLQPKSFGIGDQEIVVYTTPERFVRAEGIYVRTLPPRSPLGREMARSLDRYGRKSQLGSYVVVAPGSVAVRADDQIVNVVVVGAVVRDFDAAELVAALKRS